ncbi:MAG: CRISPR-associated helicase Cas3' [Methanophagales archaeon]|nr:CRISPR-associated helicase Cas3' [Methanophagales archaeon]
MGQMKTSSLLNNLKSHPNRFLKEHLFNVGKYCRETLSSKKLNIEKYIDFDTLQDVAYLIGVTHDFGKTTSYFQDYISEEDEKKKAKLKNKPETHHGFVSSIFTYYAIREYLLTKNLQDKRGYEYLPIIAFLVVKRHHGNLHNADDEVIDFDEKDDEILEKQIRSIDFGKLNEFYGFLLSKINLDFDCSIIKDKILDSEPVDIYGRHEFQKGYVTDLSRKEKRRIRNIDEEHTLFFYFITLLLYSILLDADKTDAANLEEIKRIDINENIVDAYKELKFGGKEDKNKKINDMRNEIYEEVLSNVERINVDKDKIMSLNVPTGTGKTLTALSFALKLRKRIESEGDYKPRIIYSLPFLSIIDQNFAVFEDVFEIVNKENPTSDILLKHHHLSDVIYTRKEDEFENVDKDIGKDLLLIEGWNSEIVVTTFIQFFYSLISNRNRAIRRVHNITNSIVILDEVQAIPHKYWPLLNKTMNFFAELFNTYFILITATQPLIFDETKKEISPLVENKRKYFDSLNRVKLITNLESVCLEDFKEILRKDILQNSNKDFLVVLNTIRSSKDIYDFVTGLNIKNVALYYLSTNIIPKERLIRIKKIKEKSATRSIIVSTQLIEAGVDIDADIVYRDFAPLDSINQVSGRCNRNFGDKQGIVKLFILREDKDGRAYYPHTIYGSFIISKTKEVFKEIDKEEIEEREFLKLNENYFEKVKIGKSEDESNSILEKVEKLKFSELSDFKLIEKEYPEVDVFIELDDNAKSVWQKYQEINSIDDLKERKKRFFSIKKEFYDYVISVPEKYKNQVDFDEKMGIGYISKSEIDQGNGYDPETGFKRDSPDGGTLIF